MLDWNLMWFQPAPLRLFGTAVRAEHDQVGSGWRQQAQREPSSSSRAVREVYRPRAGYSRLTVAVGLPLDRAATQAGAATRSRERSRELWPSGLQGCAQIVLNLEYPGWYRWLASCWRSARARA